MELKVLLFFSYRRIDEKYNLFIAMDDSLLSVKFSVKESREK